MNVLTWTLVIIFLQGCQPEEIFKKNALIADNASVPEETKEIKVSYRISDPLEEDTQLTWFTKDGTALGGDDYIAVSAARSTILAGESGGELTIAVHGDFLDEDDEFFTIVLVPDSSVKEGAQRRNIQVTNLKVTIIDDDDPPVLAIENNNIVVNEDIGEAVIRYSLTEVSGRTKQFLWRTQDDTTGGSSDYATQNGKWEKIPPDSTSGELRIPIVDDKLNELDESFKVVLDPRTFSGVAVADPSSLEITISIRDNDLAPSIRVEDVEVREGVPQASIGYQIVGESALPMRFRWFTRNGSASAGSDYTAQDEQVMVQPGVNSGYLHIPITNDELWNESREEFSVVIDSSSLEGLQVGGSRLQANVGIVNRAMPTAKLTIRNKNLVIDEGGKEAVIHYSLTGASGGAMQFLWRTQDITTSGSADYAAHSGKWVRMPQGSRGGSMKISIVDDIVFEPSESFKVVLDTRTFSGVSVADPSNLEIIITIRDDDSSDPSIRLVNSEVREGVAQASVRYELLGNTSQPMGFRWYTRDGTATAGSDYTAKNETVLIPPGTNQGYLSIPITKDEEWSEGREEFSVIIDPSSLRALRVPGSVLQSKVRIVNRVKPPVPTYISEEFPQLEEDEQEALPVDILWAVDDSVSMKPKQEALGDNFEQFIDHFATQQAGDSGVDFKMAIITTSSSIDASGGRLTRANLIADGKKLFTEKFEEDIKVGIAGLPVEKGFKFSYDFLSANSAWIRRDAFLIIIYVSDENDCSMTEYNGHNGSINLTSDSPMDWVQALRGFKNKKHLLRIYSIVETSTGKDRDHNCFVFKDNQYGKRYMNASNITGGIVRGIRSQFSEALQDFASSIKSLLSSFVLSHAPVANRVTVEVIVNGKEIPSTEGVDWTYDSHLRLVKFKSGSVPPAGATVKISYTYLN